MNEERLVVMVKNPALTGVKTRLAGQLGPGLAETVYRSFVADILRTVRRASLDCTVAFTPPGSQESLLDWLGKDMPLMEQTGRDLGARMKNIFLSLFHEGRSRIVLVGSDIPDLTEELIKDAFLHLKERDAVIGPALDGGYYLIGFTKEGFLPDIFEGMKWSTAGVFGKTMEIFSRMGRKVHILPRWSDVDTLSDLKNLLGRHERTEFRDSDTIACILKYKDRIFS